MALALSSSHVCIGFKEKIYHTLKKVPKGYVVSYKELAMAVNSKAYRVVGSLMRKNKDPISIPCYKVVLSNGRVGKYSCEGGIKRKIKLLKKDGISVVNGRIEDFERRLWKFKD